jgi:hypothetical protein
MAYINNVDSDFSDEPSLIYYVHLFISVVQTIAKHYGPCALAPKSYSGKVNHRMAPITVRNIGGAALALFSSYVLPVSAAKVTIFHEALNNTSLWSVTNYNEKIWSRDSPVGNISIGDGPTAVAYDGSTYVFHNNASGSPGLYYFVPETGQAAVVPDVESSYSPSAVVYSERLFLFHAGAGSKNNTLWFNVFDGEEWDEDTLLGTATLSDGPGAVTYNNFIYVFHQFNNSLWYTAFDGVNWLNDTQVANTSMTSSPSGVVFKNRLYVFHKGGLNDNQLWYNVFDGTSWQGDKPVFGTALYDGPTPVVNGNKITVYYRGIDNFLHQTTFDGTNWTGDLLAPDVRLGSRPAVVIT